MRGISRESLSLRRRNPTAQAPVEPFTLRQAANKAKNQLEARLQRTKLSSKPVVVDLVVTKACNLACTFCKDYEHPGAKKVERENFERVAAELFPTARWLNICSGGEPYLHTGLEDLLRLAKRYKLKNWVLSNAMLLKEERMREIFEEGLIDSHGFSIDGIENETVETIRVNSKLPTILEKLDMVLRLRREIGGKKPEIVIRYALMRRNIEELPRAVEYWGERGADRLDTGYLSLANGIEEDESLFFHQDLASKVFDEARRVAERYPNLMLRLPKLLADQERMKQRPTNCTAPWDFVMIDTSGAVLPCYRAFEALAMGNLYTGEGGSFSDIWNSEPYQALRRTVNNDSEPKHYGYCAVCENRYGWSDLKAHLGDETWAEAAADGGVAFDHKRKGFKSYEESDKAKSES